MKTKTKLPKPPGYISMIQSMDILFKAYLHFAGPEKWRWSKTMRSENNYVTVCYIVNDNVQMVYTLSTKGTASRYLYMVTKMPDQPFTKTAHAFTFRQLTKILRSDILVKAVNEIPVWL